MTNISSSKDEEMYNEIDMLNVAILNLYRSHSSWGLKEIKRYRIKLEKKFRKIRERKAI